MLGPDHDRWISEQVVPHSLSELEDCAIAVDATYYLGLYPQHEPLVSALGGFTGIEEWIEADLNRWHEHRITPLFVFDGQSIEGQEHVETRRARQANRDTDVAWKLYASSKPGEAVDKFGASTGAFSVQSLYPVMQRILKKRQLHFLVPPFNATAQLAYFDMIDSDQCAGIMGSDELLLYPIRDCVIRSINFDDKVVKAISKKGVIQALNVSSALFVDAFLMTGTSFLPPFPPLLNPDLNKERPHRIIDAVNLLRTTNKSVKQACDSFNDMIKKTADPDWLDRYCKAKMTVEHFIYISENGKVMVHQLDSLTQDNHVYLGLQLPSELYHYLNTGLIGARFLNWITHSQMRILPTLDGYASEEYKKLVSGQLVRVREAALGLVIPRLNRGISHKQMAMKIWYDSTTSAPTAWDPQAEKPDFIKQTMSWNVRKSATRDLFPPNFKHASILDEVLALKRPEVAKQTVTVPQEKVKGLDAPGVIQSITLWRFLHLRGYVNDVHQLTSWGSALAAALSSFASTVTKNPEVPYLYESVLVSFELLRLGLLNAKYKHDDLGGLPLQKNEDDIDSALLISRCATLLKLRHDSIGYTGPLSKSALYYRSLVSEVRCADRDLIEAILASLFLYAQGSRKQDDFWKLGHQLPFLFDPDVAMTIAVKTWLDDMVSNGHDPERRAARLQVFPDSFCPHALNFAEDLQISYALFDAIYAGIKVLEPKDLPTTERAVWDKAATYLGERR